MKTARRERGEGHKMADGLAPKGRGHKQRLADLANKQEAAKRLASKQTVEEREDGDPIPSTAVAQAAQIESTAAAAPAKPKPSFRGKSTIEEPVHRVWLIADQMATKAKRDGEPAPRRKDVVAACQAAGIAFYTARTQYQAWFAHTDRGRKLISEGNAIQKKNNKPEIVDDEE